MVTLARKRPPNGIARVTAMGTTGSRSVHDISGQDVWATCGECRHDSSRPSSCSKVFPLAQFTCGSPSPPARSYTAILREGRPAARPRVFGAEFRNCRGLARGECPAPAPLHRLQANQLTPQRTNAGSTYPNLPRTGHTTMPRCLPDGLATWPSRAARVHRLRPHRCNRTLGTHAAPK